MLYFFELDDWLKSGKLSLPEDDMPIGKQHPASYADQSNYCSALGKEMKRIEENYQRITDDKRLFDIRFWQSQGDIAIFEAATEMLNDYFLIRGKNADESRLQRTIETFRKV